MEYEAEELRNTISRQMFYRSGAPERLLAALSAKSPKEIARH